MARGTFDPTVKAWVEKGSKTIWSPELKGWVSRSGAVFRGGQPTHYNALNPDEQGVAVQYAAKLPTLFPMQGAGLAQPAPAQPAAPVAPAAPIVQRPNPIQSVVTSQPPKNELAEFARRIGAMK